jgi:hypothetical protein
VGPGWIHTFDQMADKFLGWPARFLNPGKCRLPARSQAIVYQGSTRNYSITTRVDDGRGGAAEATTGVEVKAVPPPPQASKMSECAFGKPLSTRIDNVCKRIFDDVALRLQSEPRASAVIIGYSDPKEAKPDKIAGDRATNGVKYLGEKGIDASRVKTRTSSGQVGAEQNRRIDVIWVPEGATY